MLTRLTRVASLVVAAWLVAIAVNLLLLGHAWDLAVRDLVMALVQQPPGPALAAR